MPVSEKNPYILFQMNRDGYGVGRPKFTSGQTVEELLRKAYNDLRGLTPKAWPVAITNKEGQCVKDQTQIMRYVIAERDKERVRLQMKAHKEATA